MRKLNIALAMAIAGMNLFAARGFCLNVPLWVRNPGSTLHRVSEPVSTGVPLPESAHVLDAAKLAVLTQDGKVRPAQFKVLARWHGVPSDVTKPIKWVLVHFQADVGMEEVTGFVLTDKAENATPPEPVQVNTTEGAFIVDTGEGRFVLSRNHFNFFDQVYVKKGVSSRMLPIVFQEGAGGLELIDADGQVFNTVMEPPEQMEVEEWGPMRAVVRIRGVFRSKTGEYFAPVVRNSQQYPRFSQPYRASFFYYNCRMYFYAGKSYVRIVLTIENNGSNGRTNPESSYAPIQAVIFDELNAVWHLSSPSSAVVKTEGITLMMNPADHFQLTQDWHENLSDSKKGTREPLFEKGPYYEVDVNGQVMSTGARHPGWIQVERADHKAIGLAVLHFWENFPKTIVVSQGEIRLGLWPAEGYYPHCRSDDFPESAYDLYCRKAGRDPNLYLFDGGRHKTHEFIVDFASSEKELSAEHLLVSLRHPLMAMPEPQWFTETEAFGMLAPNSLGHTDPGLNEAMGRFHRLQEALVNPEVSENGWTLAKLKTQNPPHWAYSRQDRYFGWMHFGDLLWSGQVPSALHYDWCLVMGLNYLRTGAFPYFEAAREMCRHRYDVDQYHGEREDTQGNHKWINHMAFYETDGHADPTIAAYMPSRVAGPSHTWNGGLVLWSLLTGDEKAWEAAQEVGMAAVNYFGPGGLKDASHPACASEETRSETWPMLNLIHLYRASGDPAVLHLALNIAKNRILFREQKAGGKGLFGMGNDCEHLDPTRQYNTMYSYALEPIIQVHRETSDPELGGLIVRMADFMKDEYLFGGDTNAAGLYRPLQSLYVWDESDPEGLQSGKTGEPVKDTFNGDMFAYAYFITKKNEYMDWARRSFRDTMFYYTVKGSTYINPSYRAKISFIDEMFSGTETKVHGWLGRTNHTYLFIESRP